MMTIDEFKALRVAPAPKKRNKYGAKKSGGSAGNLLEKECSYYADFVYIKDGKTVVEDTKGVRTKEYRIKRKLMLHVHGISIVEI